MTPKRAAFIKSLYVPWTVVSDRLWYADDATLDEWMNTVYKFSMTADREDVLREKYLQGELVNRLGGNPIEWKTALAKFAQLLIDIDLDQCHTWPTEDERFAMYWKHLDLFSQALLPTADHTVPHPNELYLERQRSAKCRYDAYMAEDSLN